MTPFAIAGRMIGPAHPPLVIAELSGNHNQSLDRALALIDAAADSGAEAVKLQTYTPDTITIDHDGPGFRIESGLWAGRTLHDLYAEAFTPYAWHAPLFAHGRRRGLIVFSSPFDDTAVDLLEGLEAPAYKIASFEAIDLPLIQRAARTGKPLIISTGMTSPEEIAEAVEAAQGAGDGGVALLHCVSAYPARYEDANLRAISRLAADYGCVVGLSDHTPGASTAVAAVALGACIIEKHVTLARADGRPRRRLQPGAGGAETAGGGLPQRLVRPRRRRPDAGGRREGQQAVSPFALRRAGRGEGRGADRRRRPLHPSRLWARAQASARGAGPAGGAGPEAGRALRLGDDRLTVSA